ncbi:MAG: hypothetical protein ACKV2O_16690, partial [Acidimicrobiales bacterium]
AVPGPQPVGAPESLLGAAWLAALQRAVEAPQVPARRPLRLLIGADQADQDAARLLAQWLSRLGHQVRRPPSQTGNTPGSPRPTKGTGRAPNGAAGRAEPVDGQPDPWAGRLLEAMWGTDVVLFLVSDAATTSPRVHREVHLAGAERTTVMPVVVHPAVLPEDLSYYLQRVAPVELQHDPAAGLAVLQSRLDRCQPKRLARPWQLIRRLVSVGLVIAMVVLVVAFLAW